MGRPVVGIGLHKTLVSAAADDDVARAREDARRRMLFGNQEWFETRLGRIASELRTEVAWRHAEVRQEIAAGDSALLAALTEGLSKIRREIADMRDDVLRWSFVFCLGQVIATATLVALLVRFFDGR